MRGLGRRDGKLDWNVYMCVCLCVISSVYGWYPVVLSVLLFYFHARKVSLFSGTVWVMGACL